MNKELVKRLISSIIMLPLVLIFMFSGSKLFMLFLSLVFIVTSYEWLKMCKKNFFLIVLGVSFLIFSFYTAYKLRDSTSIDFCVFIIIICIFTDIGGYIFGKFFQGPKLTKISPNKTYSGLIGSFLLPLIFTFIYKLFFIPPLNIISNFKLLQLNLGVDLTIIIFILIISLISQLGDLIISYFKRKSNVKDTGKILPGHGGFLDRIDGIIFVIPFSYLSII